MRRGWKVFLCSMMAMMMSFGGVPTLASQQVKAEDEITTKYNVEEVKVEGYREIQEANEVLDEIAPVYKDDFTTNDRMVKLNIQKDGILRLELDGWNGSDYNKTFTVYDKDKKQIGQSWKMNKEQQFCLESVKAGDVYYIQIPKGQEVRLFAGTLSLIQENMNPLEYYAVTTNNSNLYRTLNLKKRSVVKLEIQNWMDGNKASKVWMEQKENGKWKTVANTIQLKSGEVQYGLKAGTYRVGINTSESKVISFSYDVTSYKKAYATKRSKAKKLIKEKYYPKNDYANDLFTVSEKASRWYRFTKSSAKKKLYLSANGNAGYVTYYIYKSGSKKVSKKVTVKNTTKKVTLSKGKKTYVIKVKKSNKKFNGLYGISVE